jgi:hypothetical protein
MAKLLPGSEVVDTDYSLSDWREREAARLEAISQKYATGDGVSGEFLRFPRGDGYAVYVVVRAKPLTLVHVKIGDAWTIEGYAIRGLRLSDVQALIERRRRVAELFGEKP